jgi:hypothetical protein
MIRNGLYAVTSKLLDGVEGGAPGVSVMQDGTMRGGGSIYYTLEVTPAPAASGRAN